MNNCEKKLRDYEWIKRNILESRKQIETIKDTLDSLRGLSSSSDFDGMPHTRSIRDSVELACERIEQETINLKSWNSKLEEYCAEELEVLGWLDSMTELQRRVVELRAIKGLRWRSVSCMCNYSVAQCKRIYYSAINVEGKDG